MRWVSASIESAEDGSQDKGDAREHRHYSYTAILGAFFATKPEDDANSCALYIARCHRTVKAPRPECVETCHLHCSDKRDDRNNAGVGQLRREKREKQNDEKLDALKSKVDGECTLF
jgi:hypothetical protein